MVLSVPTQCKLKLRIGATNLSLTRMWFPCVGVAVCVCICVEEMS